MKQGQPGTDEVGMRDFDVMCRFQHRAMLFAFLFARLTLSVSAAPIPDEAAEKDQAACRALVNIRNLTVLSAELKPADGSAPRHCYLRGLISPAIHYHMQLPLPSAWNGRLVNIGDGGKDGDLDFENQRLAQGFAVANSNTGHDAGSEPGAWFGFNNRQAEIDFGYRAIHVLTVASKTVVKAYYGKEAHHSYFEGCSTGGRQALMEAQRFPFDYDGIVAGAPVIFYQESNASHAWLLQQLYRNKFENNLAFDTDGDSVPDSLAKMELLRQAVLAKCDARDGIKDGVIDDPLTCDFKPEADLAANMCPGDRNADGCFTRGQIQTIRNIYGGGRDSQGRSIVKGKAFGSEFSWAGSLVPHAGNDLFPGRLTTSGDHLNFLLYEKDPGVPPPDLTDLSYSLQKKGALPEYAWWEVNLDDFAAGKIDAMISLTDAKDPDLTRMLLKKKAKLLVYHGWADAAANPEPTLDYYNDMVKATFKGDLQAAREHARLFMAPGMDHCGGGPGPNVWDKLAPLVDWVEKGQAPDYLVASRLSSGRIENQRRICAYPQKAVFAGPAGSANDPAQWVERNFVCK